MVKKLRTMGPLYFLFMVLFLVLASSGPAQAGKVTWPEPRVFTNSLVVASTSAAAIGDDDTDVALYVLEVDKDNPSAALFQTGNPTELNRQAVCYTATMHTRGQSTGTLPKQQYSVKVNGTSDADTYGAWAQPSGNFLGMTQGGKHWVFNAPWYDLSMVRNRMAFDMQRTLGVNTGSNAWAPRTKYFELFVVYNQPTGTAPDVPQILDGYAGLYINMEHIRAESHRVPIPDDYSKTAAGTVGGLLLQINSQSDNSKKQLAPVQVANTGDPMVVQWPEADYFEQNDAAKTQFDLVQNWYYEPEQSRPFKGWAALFTNGCINPPPTNGPAVLTPDTCMGGMTEDNYWELVELYTDYRSMAEYFILNEIAKDPDGYHRSTFMYRDPDTPPAKDSLAPPTPGKIYGGPLWDKNKSYNNQDLHRCKVYYQTDGWLFTALENSQAPWWWFVLTQRQGFQQELLTVWNAAQDQKTGAFSYHRIKGKVDEYQSELTSSGAYVRDYELYHGTAAEGAAKLTSEVNLVLDYLQDRLVWLGDNLDKVGEAESSSCP